MLRIIKENRRRVIVIIGGTIALVFGVISTGVPRVPLILLGGFIILITTLYWIADNA